MSRLLRWSVVRSLLVLLGIPFTGASLGAACLSGECATRATNDPLRASGSGSGDGECSGTGSGSGTTDGAGGTGGHIPAVGGGGGTAPTGGAGGTGGA